MQTKTNDRVYAGFFVRLAAYLIDWLIVGTVLLIVKIPLWIMSMSAPDNILARDFIFQYSVSDIVIYVLTAVYFILLTYYTGATLGKHLLHLRVVSVEERKPSFFEILYRETVGKFLSGVFICIGYLMIGLDGKKRGLHDILADTSVIYYHEKKRYVVPPVVYRNVNTAVPPQNFQGNRPYMPAQERPQNMEPDFVPVQEHPQNMEPDFVPVQEHPQNMEPDFVSAQEQSRNPEPDSGLVQEEYQNAGQESSRN